MSILSWYGTMIFRYKIKNVSSNTILSLPTQTRLHNLLRYYTENVEWRSTCVLRTNWSNLLKTITGGVLWPFIGGYNISLQLVRFIGNRWWYRRKKVVSRLVLISFLRTWRNRSVWDLHEIEGMFIYNPFFLCTFVRRIELGDHLKFRVEVRFILCMKVKRRLW